MGPYNHVDFILFEPEKYVDSRVSEESVPPGPVLEDQHRFSPGETWLQLVLPCLPRGRLMFIACAILIYTIYIIYTYIYIYIYACISLSTKMRCYTSALKTRAWMSHFQEVWNRSIQCRATKDKVEVIVGEFFSGIKHESEGNAHLVLSLLAISLNKMRCWWIFRI